MTTDEIMQQLAGVFSDVFDEDVPLTSETTSQDIDGWDSFANVRLMVSVEAAFRIRFDVAEFEGFQNVGELVACLQRKLS